MVGPSMRSAPRIIDWSTLACWSSSRGTSCGIMPAIAGSTSAKVMPLSASSAISIQSSAMSVMTSARTHPGSRPAPGCQAEDQHPRQPVRDHPTEQQEEHHRDRVARQHRAQRTGESCTSRTANASATGAIVAPIMLTV